MYGNGNGTFTFQTEISTHSQGIMYSYLNVVADLNNDQLLDIAIINPDQHTVGIFFANSNGTFQPQITFSTLEQDRPETILVGDFNNDNHLDICVTASPFNEVAK
jgi:hypothetical protein